MAKLRPTAAFSVSMATKRSVRHRFSTTREAAALADRVQAREPTAGAGVAELVDALGLGSSDASRGGSSPSARTNGVALQISPCEFGALGPRIGLEGLRQCR